MTRNKPILLPFIFVYLKWCLWGNCERQLRPHKPVVVGE